ncbi:MAG TPA: 30S ribosomal protein S6 [Kofleriaceae bacterium]|nr:30S ribosomal protein S6 [Kofleriaceae bacterium]
MADLQSLADAPGTLREYETIYILRPDTQNDRVADVNQRVRGIIESQGGVVLNVDNWGKRKLAYEIKKELKGIYLFWSYLGSPQVVTEFERNMRMLDPVIRYMTVLAGRDIDPGTKESLVTEETYTKAASTAADEEELMLRRTDEAASEVGEEGADGDVVAKAAPAAEGAAEPVAEPAAEGAAEPAAEPATEPAAEPKPPGTDGEAE